MVFPGSSRKEAIQMTALKNIVVSAGSARLLEATP